MKLITFIIALLLFVVGVYYLVKGEYLLASALMLTMMAFFCLIERAPNQ